ncbi:MAG: D-tagatose-bisphosphate aldolase, class II, non-catalytic subunit, partial [Lascolabacillus sp.]|uniref:D-tagatose-bisphosphate aldolase, class II, non-catalytic subunit n=1 Tax=Lascolabacillus sp. TaxID=1924068 RepID=UPI00258C0A98
MKSSLEAFLELMEANRNGLAKGIYSVCTAHPEVLEASFKQAKRDKSLLLIESTSNQVDQYGGYTGMKPLDFVEFINGIAEKTDFPKEMILLGGDHLGPNPWRKLPAAEAMDKAKVLIAEYVKAGFQKIHLDTSMFCADDEGDRTKPLSEEIVAERAAILCKVAEDTWAEYRKDFHKPVYIIGTEVPVPGGAQEEEDEVVPTSPSDAKETIAVTNKHFLKVGLEDAWNRVIGVVVQPGVEFSDDRIFAFQPEKAEELSKNILEYDRLVYEAHSTDYQTEDMLRKLVEGHFCILKVGPWLTYAYREALLSLEAMEVELLGADDPNLSRLSEILEKTMINEPKYWEPYYHGDDKQKAFKRKYSFSDRVRYYWPVKDIEEAKKRLFNNLSEIEIPLSLLSQYMPAQFYQVCKGSIKANPTDLVHSHINTVTGIYSRACGLS